MTRHRRRSLPRARGCLPWTEARDAEGVDVLRVPSSDGRTVTLRVTIVFGGVTARVARPATGSRARGSTLCAATAGSSPAGTCTWPRGATPLPPRTPVDSTGPRRRPDGRSRPRFRAPWAGRSRSTPSTRDRVAPLLVRRPAGHLPHADGQGAWRARLHQERLRRTGARPGWSSPTPDPPHGSGVNVAARWRCSASRASSTSIICICKTGLRTPPPPPPGPLTLSSPATRV